jgi:hypothetical protein
MAKKQVEEVEVFVAMTKDGQTIEVCPEQVEQHQRLGYVVVE